MLLIKDIGWGLAVTALTSGLQLQGVAILFYFNQSASHKGVVSLYAAPVFISHRKSLCHWVSRIGFLIISFGAGCTSDFMGFLYRGR